MPPREDPRAEPESLEELLRRLEPELDALFRGYGVSTAEAEDLTSESLVILEVRRARIRDRDRWLLDTLRWRCERRLEAEPERAGVAEGSRRRDTG